MAQSKRLNESNLSLRRGDEMNSRVRSSYLEEVFAAGADAAVLSVRAKEG